MCLRIGTAVLGIADADTVTCTAASGALAAFAQVVTLIAGAVPTGSPRKFFFTKYGNPGAEQRDGRHH